MKTILMIGLLALSTNVFASTKFSKIFEVAAKAECGLDCGQTEAEAQVEAEAEAQATCAPLAAVRVSDWTTTVRNYGILTTSAFFTCE